MKLDLPALLLAGIAPLMAPAGPAAAGVPRHCDNEVGGSVSRRVGNFLEGPSRLEGVPRIPVRLLRGGEEVAETRTDATGRYSFDRVCPGNYVVCPGIPCPAGGPVPSRYSPESTEIVLPRAPNKSVNFRLTEPPRREPDRVPEQRFIDIDEGIREARDMELAKGVRDYVEKTLICPDEAACRLRVSVSRGNVSLRGTVPARERLRLEKITQAVRGVRSLDLAGVTGKEQP